MLIDYAADPNLYNKLAASPLHLCVDYQAEEEARTLMLKGADPNYQDNDGKTPFHVAAQRRNVTMGSLFFESGADPEVRDANLHSVWDLCDEEYKEKIYPNDVQPSKPSSKLDGPGEDDGMQWLRDEKCFMCKDNEADRILLPCKHRVLCHNCSNQFLEEYAVCPQCHMAVFAAVKP